MARSTCSAGGFWAHASKLGRAQGEDKRNTFWKLFQLKQRVHRTALCILFNMPSPRAVVKVFSFHRYWFHSFIPKMIGNSLKQYRKCLRRWLTVWQLGCPHCPKYRLHVESLTCCSLCKAKLLDLNVALALDTEDSHVTSRHVQHLG